ncbi:MAG TPA: response regulator transcription factor [Chitinophagaceae bacterium]|jgi:DNA-binding NarL/FixJ family response regulator
MITISIIEDLKDYREALQTLIKITPDLECVGVHEKAEEALEYITALQPDVALIDINLPGMSGIDLVKKISSTSPYTLCMMCTAYDDDEKVFKALSAGAHGYLLKSTPPSKIIDAIFELKKGGSPMSAEVARKIVTAFRKKTNIEAAQLSTREREVLELLAKGLLYKEIAAQLNLSIETVRKHCFNIYEKLHVNNRTEAINKYKGY